MMRGLLLGMCGWLLANSLLAQESEQEITLHPVEPAQRSLEYRLLPFSTELKQGNAALEYSRARAQFLEGDPDDRWFEPATWMDLSAEEFPTAKAQTFLEHYTRAKALKHLHRAAYLGRCDWQLPLQEEPFASGPAQYVRELARLLALEARVHTIKGNFPAAVRSIRAGYQLARHTGESPILLQGLVASTISRMMSRELEFLIQQPKAPSLYWALGYLPQPLIDLNQAFEYELQLFQRVFPEFEQAKQADYTSEEWLAVWYGGLRKLEALLFLEWNAEVQWKPNPAKPDLTANLRVLSAAYSLWAYPEAKQKLIASGYSPEAVEAMPVAKVMLFHLQRTQQELSHQFLRWNRVPHHQRQGRETNPLDDGSRDPLVNYLMLFYDTNETVRVAGVRDQREIAFLQTLEALRLYTHQHQGKLPDSLDQINELPIPTNPVTGKPFRYRKTDSGAMLEMEAIAAEGTRRYLIRIAR